MLNIPQINVSGLTITARIYTIFTIIVSTLVLLLSVTVFFFLQIDQKEHQNKALLEQSIEFAYFETVLHKTQTGLHQGDHEQLENINPRELLALSENMLSSFSRLIAHAEKWNLKEELQLAEKHKSIVYQYRDDFFTAIATMMAGDIEKAKTLTELNLEPAGKILQVFIERTNDQRRYALANLDAEIAQLKIITFTTIISVSILGAGVLLLTLSHLSRAVIHPLRRLTDQITNIGAFSDLSQRVDVTGNDEISLLGRAFNNTLSKATASEKARADFIATISHEIRTPMNGVIGMTELLMDEELTTIQKSRANTILESARSLLVLLNDILDFSKIGDDKLELEEEDFYLDELVEQTLQILSARSRKKGVELGSYIMPGSPVAIEGDANRMRQILNNLVGNAIKFTDHGMINIDVTVLENSDHKVKFRIEVQDTGIGIPGDFIPHIFDDFTQADSSLERRYEGSGLGLSITHKLVNLMGGEIGVESTLGEGSTFWLELTFPKSTKERIPFNMRYKELAGLSVLVIDDNETNRRVFHSYLSSIGCQVHIAASGAEGIDLVRSHINQGTGFDVVVTDHCMPKISGVDFAQLIRSDDDLAGLKLILVSSAQKPGEEKWAKEKGFNGFMVRPIRRAELFDQIADVLGLCVDAPPASQTNDPINSNQNISLYILLAEDNRTNRDVALGFLKRMGHRVDIAENGQEAVSATQGNHYDLILMDIQMPEMDGLEATRQIRQMNSHCRNIPIIAATAHVMKGDKQKFIDVGMSDYVSKPLNRKKLSDILSHWGHGQEPEVQIPHDNTEAENSTENAIVDRAMLKDMMDFFDKETFNGLLKDYLNELPGMMDRLRKSIKDGDYDTVKLDAHTIKGMSGSMYVVSMERQASEMMKACDEGRTDDIEQLVQGLSQSACEAEVILTQMAE